MNEKTSFSDPVVRVRLFLPQNGEAVAVAVSGGPDSMALCRALADGATGPVYALTVDHGLRPDSAAEAVQVGRWLEGWPHVSHTVLIRPPPQPPYTRIQERARADRYTLLTGFCAARNIAMLFTAHHRDDQAETFLLRLAAGSGLDGLASIRTERILPSGVRVVRPFLDTPKETLVAFCNARAVPFVCDPSNADPAYARTRLRNARTVLEDEGLSAARLAATAARLARAKDALDFYAAALFESAVRPDESAPDRIAFDLCILAAAPEDVRLRVLRAGLDRLSPQTGYGVRLERLEMLAQKIFNDPAFRRATLGGCLFTRSAGQNRLVLRREVCS